jgi:steroid delta-isomerase-like uncharacterized protein
MQNQEHLNLVRKLFDLYNKNDMHHLNAFDELFAPNCQFHDPALGNAKMSLQNMKQAESDYIKALPNKKTKIDNIVAADDQIIVRWTATGTNKGSFHGSTPSNKEVKISGISIYRISGNKINEVWQIWDRMGMLEQMGELKMAHAHH